MVLRCFSNGVSADGLPDRFSLSGNGYETAGTR